MNIVLRCIYRFFCVVNRKIIRRKIYDILYCKLILVEQTTKRLDQE